MREGREEECNGERGGARAPWRGTWRGSSHGTRHLWPSRCRLGRVARGRGDGRRRTAGGRTRARKVGNRR
uniref:Uncharacterized protein n=1 Tax=Arundo donax TaxID=35708 RepID=A0A0A8Y3A3_ARUDO